MKLLVIRLLILASVILAANHALLWPLPVLKENVSKSAATALIRSYILPVWLVKVVGHSCIMIREVLGIQLPVMLVPSN